MADFLSPYVKYESSLSNSQPGDAGGDQVAQIITAQGVTNEAQLYDIQHNEQSNGELALLCGMLFFGFLWHWLWDMARQKR